VHFGPGARALPKVQTEPNIGWNQLTKFVGQLNHDLRNYLNAIELQAAFLSEIAGEPEAKPEVARLREMTGELNAHLQRLSHALAPVQPMTMAYLASEFVEDLQAKLNREEPELAAQIKWKISLGEEAIEIDPHLLQEAFVEILRNASRHDRGEGALVFEARPEGESVAFRLSEPKKKFEGTTENWGGRPLAGLRSGHYGLGLFRARGIFEAHHANFCAQFDSANSTLLTTATLPILAS
jgi:signal transduction histidine kinase